MRRNSHGAQLGAQFSERRLRLSAGRVVRLAMEEVKKEAEKPLSLSAARDARDSYLPKKVDADGKPTHELLSFFCPISTIGELVNTARSTRRRGTRSRSGDRSGCASRRRERGRARSALDV